MEADPDGIDESRGKWGPNGATKRVFSDEQSPMDVGAWRRWSAARGYWFVRL